MADIRLDRTDRAELALPGEPGERPLQAFRFDRIAELRPGSVRFDIRDRLGFHPGVLPGPDDDVLLRGGVRGGDADGHAVVIGRAALDDRVDGVAVPKRQVERLQHDGGDAFARARAVGALVERLGPEVRGFDPDVRLPDGSQMKLDAACDGHVAFAFPDAAASEMYGHQRG